MSDTKGERRVDWLRPLTPGAGPRYVQIADLIARAVQTGELAVGDQIPSQRWLATQLGVDLTTVTRAYTEARNRGLISSFSGRGSFVAGVGEAGDEMRIDLSMNTPPQPASGSMGDALKLAIDEVLARQGIEAMSAYQDTWSGASIVQAGRAWLRPAVGAMAGQQELIVCAGTQAAIFSLLQSRTQRGDAVLAEPLTYPGFLLTAQQLGLRVVALEVDQDGVLPDAIERSHRETGAQVIYLNPTLQNPTASTMPEHRRKAIGAMLRKLGMTLIEDDPYRYLLNDAPPPIVTYEGGERAYYLTSLSKCLWPSLRTSFVLLPRQHDAAMLQDALRASSMGCSLLLTAVAEHWMRSGQARHLMLDIQREVRARQTLARNLLPKDVNAHPTGLHLWMTLPAHWNRQLFALALEQQGVLVACSDAFSVDANPVDAVRLSVGGARSQTDLAHALQRISTLLREDRRRGVRAIV
ncbi:PLP-dependent aminotransferase family protein [Cupriavidus metallidurans]|uniref:aminotransferase-like domain-containing protein n=1 Tax=Cupriavidus metallidurans TaxID=119219 RepID=UPI001CCF5591|nr:PLP-dependent aminotransferase family protein [Cupriavidus metallidurans]UBM08282.1 PLP-dependent aminotransferase family protein [Cupriavidus metallidurans]